MRPTSLLVALLLLAGCTATPDADEAVPPTTEESAPDAAVPAPVPVVLADSREGLLLYRLADEGVNENYQGDPHSFCLALPQGILAVDLTLTWDDPRPLLLEFQTTGKRYSNWDDDPVQTLFVTSPSTLHVETPRDGTWQVFIGPALADAARAWHLDLAWTVPAGMTLDQIVDEGYCG